MLEVVRELLGQVVRCCLAGLDFVHSLFSSPELRLQSMYQYGALEEGSKLTLYGNCPFCVLPASRHLISSQGLFLSIRDPTLGRREYRENTYNLNAPLKDVLLMTLPGFLFGPSVALTSSGRKAAVTKYIAATLVSKARIRPKRKRGSPCQLAAFGNAK